MMSVAVPIAARNSGAERELVWLLDRFTGIGEPNEAFVIDDGDDWGVPGAGIVISDPLGLLKAFRNHRGLGTFEESDSFVFRPLVVEVSRDSTLVGREGLVRELIKRTTGEELPDDITDGGWTLCGEVFPEEPLSRVRLMALGQALKLWGGRRGETISPRGDHGVLQL